jgi:hypothetical protein
MTEETKQQTAKKEARGTLAMLLKVSIGLILLVLGAWSLLSWWQELLVIVKGTIGLFLILGGIIALAIAKE